MGHGSTSEKAGSDAGDKQVNFLFPGTLLATEQLYVDAHGVQFIYHGEDVVLVAAYAHQGVPDSGEAQPKFNVLIAGTPALVEDKALEATGNTPSSGVIDTGNRSISDGDRVDFRVIQGTNEDAHTISVDLVLHPTT